MYDADEIISTVGPNGHRTLSSIQIEIMQILLFCSYIVHNTTMHMAGLNMFVTEYECCLHILYHYVRRITKRISQCVLASHRHYIIHIRDEKSQCYVK
jgi:hypothetical protein